MPELPEVETIVRNLRSKVRKLSIMDVCICDQRVIRNQTPADFVRQIKGRSIIDVVRRGKAIIIPLSGNTAFLVIQVMMTGQLVYLRKNELKRHTKIIFLLSNKHYLHYNDQRLFGRLQVVDDIRRLKYFQTIGPEPFSKDFNIDWLANTLQTKKGPIKPLLMNHTFLAGIGNIYASEILFRCRLNPKRPANSLGTKEIKSLHTETRNVLNEAIEFRGTTIINYRDHAGRKGNFINRIKVYGKEDQCCPRCRAKINKIVLNGRSTFYCDVCQV